MSFKTLYDVIALTPYDGSGNYVRVTDWTSDRDAGIKIVADRHDQQDDDFAAALTGVITRNGQTQITADIPFNGKKITGLADPTNPQDAATKAFAEGVRTFNTAMTVSGAAAQARIKFTGTTGPWGFEFPTADLSFGVRDGVSNTAHTRFVWNEKPDLSGQDIMTLAAGPTAQLGVGLSPPIAGHSGVYAGVLSTNENVTFNAYYSATDSHWKYQAAGWAMLITAPTTASSFAIYRSKISGAADAVIEWVSWLTFNASKQANFPAAVFAASAYLNTDGNIAGPNPGSIWKNMAGGVHADAYSAITTQIEQRAAAHANNAIAYIRLTSETWMDATTSGSGNKLDPGAPWICTAFQKIGGDNYRLYFRALQYVNGNGVVTNIAIA